MDTAKKLADALRNLSQLAYTQNGNRYDDVNQMLVRAGEALDAYDESQRLDLPELPRGDHFDAQMRRETFSASQMESYALAARANAPRPEGLLIVGDVVTGFTFVGPFACESDAAAYFQQRRKPGEDWQTCTMRAPETNA